jgi:hypothetical protein
MSLLPGNAPRSLGNTLSSLKTSIQETANKAASTFKNNFPFTKVSSTAEPINELARRQAIAGAEQIASTFAGNALVDSATRDLLNEPTTAIVTAQQLNSIIRQNGTDTSHRVKLVEIGGNPDGKDLVVEFRVMPEIFESRTVEYQAVAPPQHPGAFQKYTGTSSTQWTVNATLTCRTTVEATENLAILNLLRGWTMPFFGSRTRDTYGQKLGAPPPVLEFSGFRSQMIGPVPVVMTSATWTFPQDVDYIPAASNDGTQLIPFPTVLRITINLVETFSSEQFNGFDLYEFRQGNFRKAYAPHKTMGIQDRMRLQVNAPQEAQVVDGNYSNEGKNYPPSTNNPNYSNEGRNYPPFTNNPNYSNEGRNWRRVVSERKEAVPSIPSGTGDFPDFTIPPYGRVGSPPATAKTARRRFISGGGGNFGGGGASGVAGPDDTSIFRTGEF